ncbi:MULTISPECIES: hypothetical protein [unclassified Pseudomonas]|uniref:hypothetical protein n=1 Tax=unclassified Pseudomonas TaxID=196821 RepID=UPI001CBB05DE|nr:MULTISPECIES: hypothetical protein [unclassified Pseudomonas]
MSNETLSAVTAGEQLHVVFTPDHEEDDYGLSVDISEWLSSTDLQSLSLFWTHRKVSNIGAIGKALEWFYVDKNQELKDLVEHCEKVNREVMPYGYLCSFNADVIKAWIIENRADLGNSLVCLRNSVMIRTADGKSFFWNELDGQSRSTEQFESELDAANNAIAVLNLA